MIERTCVFSRLDVVFDSYIEDSIKEGERRRRSTCEPLKYQIMSLNTPIPIQTEQCRIVRPVLQIKNHSKVYVETF